MADLEKDIRYLDDVYDGINHKRYSTLFSRNTENVGKVLDYIDVNGKDIYAVLSSSDILFSLKVKGANVVDTFDTNPLTYRYFFLRKWLLQNSLIEASDLKREIMYQIINYHLPLTNKDEEESMTLWNHYLNRLCKDDDCDWYFNFYNARLFDDPYDRYSVPFEKQIELLNNMLHSFIIHFDNIDICEKQDKPFPKKYDLVYLSNILDLKDADEVKNARDNLVELLKDNGSVICSNIRNYPYFPQREEEGKRKIFSEFFEYHELFTEFRGITQSNPIHYYQYIKK